MPAPTPRLPRASCPVCHSRNVLEVAVTAKVASLYCLACEHLFAAEIPAEQNPATPPPAIRPPKPRLASLQLARPAA